MMLDAGDARVTVDPERGGRIASLQVGDLELLVADHEVDDDPTLWGCYPMVPWAGRVRDGRFDFEGTTHQLPRDAPPHALHGLGHRAAWEVVGSDTLRLALGWELGGVAVQTFALTPDALHLTMTVTAGARAMPVMAGWHPCFPRRLNRGGEVELAVELGSMWERDPVGIPTGRQVPVPPGPWDDCFADLVGDPRLTWPGAAALSLRSTCPAWVVYDQDPRLVCVEPQTDAPDAFNRSPTVLEPGEELEIRLTMEWST